MQTGGRWCPVRRAISVESVPSRRGNEFSVPECSAAETVGFGAATGVAGRFFVRGALGIIRWSPNRFATGALHQIQAAGHPPGFGTRRRPRSRGSATSHSRCRLAAKERPSIRPLLNFSSRACHVSWVVPSRSQTSDPDGLPSRGLRAKIALHVLVSIPVLAAGVTGVRGRRDKRSHSG